MRVLISCLPGHGHLYPFIPLMQALQRAGHEVAVATSASWQRTLADLGIPLLAAGPDWRESDFDFDTARPGSGNGAVRFGNFLLEQVVPPMLDDVRRHVGEWQPDLMLGNDFEPVGRTVAELAGIPFVLATHGARLGQRMRRQALANLSAACRRLCGLPEVSELDYPLRWLHLGFVHPDYLAYPGNPDRPGGEYFIQPAIHDGSRGDAIMPSPWPDANLPIVLCTMGTVFNKNAVIFSAIVAACTGQPFRLVILGAAATGAAWSKDLPENIVALPFTPLSRILPLATACISHGGTATMSSIMMHGKPMLVLPQGADHLPNTNACNHLRIGIGLGDAPHLGSGPALERRLRKIVRQSLLELLGNPVYGENCARVQQQLHRLPGLERAVSLLEKIRPEAVQA